MAASQKSFQNHRPGMWEDGAAGHNNIEQHASIGSTEPLVDGLGGGKR